MSDSKCCLRIGALESWWTVMFITCLWLNVGHAQGLKRDLTRQSDVNEYADELTGFGRLKGLTKSFTRVDVNDNNTPFLHAQINGKKGVWLVEIKNVRLKLKSAAPGFKDKYVRTFQVFVDPNTGHLLKITSTFDGNDPNMLPEPPAAVAEAQMKNSGDETYHGFPNEPPKVSLLDALNEVTVGNPLFAKEIYHYNAILAQDFQAVSRFLLSEPVILKGDMEWTPKRLNN